MTPPVKWVLRVVSLPVVVLLAVAVAGAVLVEAIVASRLGQWLGWVWETER